MGESKPDSFLTGIRDALSAEDLAIIDSVPPSEELRREAVNLQGD